LSQTEWYNVLNASLTLLNREAFSFMAESLTGVEQVIKQLTGHPPRILFVLAGPSGVGKNTIIRKLLANHAGQMERIRTYTTRSPREDEVEGEQYHFVSPEQFRELAFAGKLMEADRDSVGHDVYGLGHVYSMPSDLFEEIPPDKHLVIAEVDIHGMRRIKERYPDSVTIFVTAPPLDLLQRIRVRRDSEMDAEALSKRMQTAQEQIRAAREFDYVIFNQEDQLDEAVQAIEAIILAERERVRPGFDLEASVPEEAFLLSLK
jgi:guanylate kinase